MSYRTTRAADARIAEDSAAEQAQMCCAIGCPNRWSVNAGQGKCCSAHAWSDPFLWPRITQEQQDAAVDRSRRETADPRRPTYTLTREQRLEILTTLRGLFAQRPDPRAWARRLHDREQAGQRLTLTQRAMMRSVLHDSSVVDVHDVREVAVAALEGWE